MNPFRSELTQEIVDTMPAEQRGPWQQLLDGQLAHREQVEHLASDRQFVRALNLVGSEERADRIVTWSEQYRLTDAEAEHIVRECWSITEAWSADPRLRDGMYALLKRCAMVEVIDEDNPRPFPAVKMLTVYRGNLGESPGDHLASWTLDPEIAERFALMANSPRGWFLGMSTLDAPGIPTVWRAEVSSSHVLGYFDDRGEQEVVFDGIYKRRVTKVKAVLAGKDCA